MTQEAADLGNGAKDHDHAPSMAAIGAQIRALRRKRGLTLHQVAGAAGLSTAMISKVENGNGNPSINTLVQIARALSVPTAMLFSREDEELDAVQFNHKRVYAFGGVSYTVVMPDAHGTRLLLVEAEPGAERGSPLFPHSPHEGHEQGILLQGEMDLTVNGERYLLAKGDTISFPSRLVHQWRNPGDVVMRAAWTISVEADLADTSG